MNSIKNMVINPLLMLEPNNNFIKRIEKNYDDLVNFLNNDRKIRIALLGLYSSGKSTILNSLIGKQILPTSSDECTNRGIIIRYHNKDEPELYKTKFIQKLDYYSFQDSDKPLCSGFKSNFLDSILLIISVNASTLLCSLIKSFLFININPSIIFIKGLKIS